MGARAIEGLIWLAFAALAFALTYEFDQPLRGYAFGAAGWPRAMILMIGVGAVGLLISGLLASRSADGGAGTSESGSNDRPETGVQRGNSAAGGWRRALEPKRLLTFGLPLAYVLAMHRFGFLFVSPVFLIAYMYLFGYRRWPVLIGVNLVIYGVVLLIFVRLLYTAFPPGQGIFHSLTGQFVDFIQ